MSDSPRDPPPPRPSAPGWLDELGARLVDWLGALLNPPVPVPVPVRAPARRRRR